MQKPFLAVAILATCSLPLSARPSAHHARKLEFVGIGDSVTRGYGSGPGLSYFDLVTKDLKVSHPKLIVKNKSKNGSDSKAHVKQVASLPRADRDTYGIIMVTTGGNDLMHDFGKSKPKDAALYGATLKEALPFVANFRGRLRHALSALSARFPGGCDIYLCTIYDPTDGRGDLHDLDHVWPVWPDSVAVHSAYNHAIVECSHMPHVHLVDVYRAFLGHGEHSADFKKHGYFFDNQEDLNDRGQHALHDLIWPKIQAGLGGPSKAPQSPDTKSFKDDD